METGGDGEKRDVRRPMNAFLIFCKRHRSIVREKNPDLDNRSVTRILGDLWANLKENEKVVYTDLAKQYKDAFMKANPDYKWHNPEKTVTGQKIAMPKPTNVKVIRNELEVLPEGSIMPGKLADPSNMGGLSLLLIAGQQSEKDPSPLSQISPVTMETRENDTDQISPLPVNKVKWDEEKFTRNVVEQQVTTKQKDGATMKVEAKGSTDCLPQTNTEKSGVTRSEIIVHSMSNTKTEDYNCKTLVSGIPQMDMDRAVPVKTETKAESEPVWGMDGAKLENHSKPNIQKWNIDDSQTKGKDATNHSLMALAEMCDDRTLPIPTSVEMPAKTLLYQAVAAPKMPQRSLLAEAFLDTCDKGGYSDILRDNSSISKNAKGDNFKYHENKLEQFDSSSEFNEKENISKLIMKDVKDCKDSSEEESPMITCGKLVVNHIIDRLFSSDIAAAARKAHNTHFERAKTKETCIDKTESMDTHTNKLETPHVKAFHERMDSDTGKTNIRNDCVHDVSSDAKISSNGESVYDEHDGMKDDVSKCGNDTLMSGLAVDHSGIKDDVSKCGNDTLMSGMAVDPSSGADHSVTDGRLVDEQDKSVLGISQEKTDLRLKNSLNEKCPSPHYEAKDEDLAGELEDSEDYQPIRKSRRRNRGQRYQELINEGIIQPSKERMAALKHDLPKEECTEEDFQSIDSYILPETAIRRIRKRTTSESAKDKILPIDDAKRYKTGDFDLEAHIATLPACPVESMGRKRGFVRQRHHSESTHLKKQFEEPQLPVFDIKKAVSLPPHVKIPSPEKIAEPVVGSRKRKARKHSITHLLPAPTSLVTSGNDCRTNGESESALEKRVSDSAQTSMDKLDSSKSLLHLHVNKCADDTNGNELVTQKTEWQEDSENKKSTVIDSDTVCQNTETYGAALEQNSLMLEAHIVSKCGTENVTQSQSGEQVEGKAIALQSQVSETNKDLYTDYKSVNLKNRCEAERVETHASGILVGNQTESNHSGSDSASNIPGDQSKSLSHGGQRPPVYSNQNCRSETTNSTDASCFDTGCSNQNAATNKNKDMNFNTKVQC